MEKIDLNNYEAYFLDYMEGTLSVEEKHDLFQFLELHPELKAEMEEDFGMVELMPETVSFDSKESLKVDESQLVLTPTTVEEIMIASVEGQLTEVHEQELMNYIASEKLEKTYAYYKATILKPDTKAIYPEKEKLKMKTGVVIRMPFVARIATVAAAGAILVMLALNWNSTSSVIGDSQNKGNFYATDVAGGNLPNHFKKEFNGSINTGEESNTDNGSNSIGPNAQERDIIDAFQNDNSLASGNPNNEVPRDSTNKNPANEEIIVDPGQIRDINNDEIAHQDKIEREIPEEVIYNEDFSTADDVAENRVKTEEPYKVITNAASDFVNREISFTRDKDLETSNYVAYSFKLGKFEFERKKNK